jgi:hypothetical protein
VCSGVLGCWSHTFNEGAGYSKPTWPCVLCLISQIHLDCLREGWWDRLPLGCLVCLSTYLSSVLPCMCGELCNAWVLFAPCSPGCQWRRRVLPAHRELCGLWMHAYRTPNDGPGVGSHLLQRPHLRKPIRWVGTACGLFCTGLGLSYTTTPPSAMPVSVFAHTHTYACPPARALCILMQVESCNALCNSCVSPLPPPPPPPPSLPRGDPRRGCVQQPAQLRHQVCWVAGPCGPAHQWQAPGGSRGTLRLRAHPSFLRQLHRPHVSW